MDLRLAGQVAFIAGSSRGIGRAIAAALLAEGASIVLTGRNVESLERSRAELGTGLDSARILAIPGDLTVRPLIRASLERTAQHFSRLDHLIANLGTGSGTPGPVSTDEEWARLFEQNFFGSVRLTESSLPYLRANPSGGSILFISSIVAIEATPAPLPYAAAKAALTNYATNLSRHLAQDRIRVNTIAPGNIFFPGSSWEHHLAVRRKQVETFLETEVPQKRFGTPEEIASLATYLCSPAAAFSTGSTYIMDGGQTRSI